MTFKQWLYKFFTYLTQILKFSLAEVPHWKMLVLLIFHINFLCKLSHAFYVLCIFLLTVMQHQFLFFTICQHAYHYSISFPGGNENKILLSCYLISFLWKRGSNRVQTKGEQVKDNELQLNKTKQKHRKINNEIERIRNLYARFAISV